jgi:hypothetical protein
MLTNLKGCQDVWRSVKNLDIDKNGFISIQELGDLFKDYFPKEMVGKSLSNYFRKHISNYDKTLINYKPIKAEITSELTKRVQEMKHQ